MVARPGPEGHAGRTLADQAISFMAWLAGSVRASSRTLEEEGASKGISRRRRDPTSRRACGPPPRPRPPPELRRVRAPCPARTAFLEEVGGAAPSGVPR